LVKIWQKYQKTVDHLALDLYNKHIDSNKQEFKMAYVSQEMKAKLAPAIKAICKKYSVKASIAVRHHSTLVLNVKQGEIDFIENYIKTNADKIVANKMSPDTIAYIRKNQSLDVNTHWAHEHFSNDAKEFLTEMIEAMKGPEFFDHSDIQSDYFHRSHYIDINIGQWNKPYALVK
jgi:hypothetical protein